MITLALGITMYMCHASGEGMGPLLVIAMLLDFGWLMMWAMRGQE